MEENPELRTGTISADCPTSHYTIEASISSPANIELASVSAGFFIVEQPSEDSIDFVPEDPARTRCGSSRRCLPDKSRL